MDYAFRVFCAIYGHRVVEPENGNSDAICYYGLRPSSDMQQSTWIPALYRGRTADQVSYKNLRHEYAGRQLQLFWGIDRDSSSPDWLGEIFEWLTCNLEKEAATRDSIGRIPYSETIFAKEQISPRQSHAMLLMAWLENVIRNKRGRPYLPKAPCPVPGAEHLIVCSHDVDYHFAGRISALRRLLKNLVIFSRQYGDTSGFRWNARQIFGVLNGNRPGEYLGCLHEAAREFGFQSSVFVVARRGHRRDPDYALKDLSHWLPSSVSPELSVALHGSYRSILENADLSSEGRAFQESLGCKARGIRQHWLRFDTHKSLIDAVEGADLIYDSSIGFADVPGFRAGACFAYPPYHFEQERPASFLEIPLVLMDGSVESDARASGDSPAAVTSEILQESRRLGWGGIAIDWHNPMEPIQVPQQINDIFWDGLKQRDQHREKWISAEEFLRMSLHRYHDAGLLQVVASSA